LLTAITAGLPPVSALTEIISSVQSLISHIGR